MAGYIFYSGSFKDEIHIGLYNSEKNSLEYVGNIPHKGATFLTTNKKEQHLYVGCENFGGNGQIAVYDISDPRKPLLLQETDQTTQGPSFLSLSCDEKYLLTCGFFSGDIKTYSLNAEGILERQCHETFFETYGTAYPKGSFGQAVPRAHCILQVLKTRFVLITDYSGDRLVCFSLQDDGGLTQVSELAAQKGDAVRHLVFHPVYQDIVYMNAEYSTAVYVVHINMENGELTLLERYEIQRENKISMSSAVKVSKDGKYLYNASRNNEEIAVYRISGQGRKLEYIVSIPDLGYIRDFVFEPENQRMITGNQSKNIIQQFQMNWKNGMCAPLFSKIKADTPASFVFIKRAI